jgi:ferredoxin
MPKIIQFREECIGCNSCVEYAKNYWKMNDADGKSDLLGAEEKNGVFIKDIAEFEIEGNEDAALACPMKIIHIVDNTGKEIV